jgi:outer membrane protein
LCAAVFAAPAMAQKIGWINSGAIMAKLPEALDAQHQLDNAAADWQAELAKMQNDRAKKLDEYDKKKLILTDQLRAESEKELQDLDKKIVDYQTKKFGPNGDLFQKQNDLMKPIQNKIFDVLKQIATDDNYDYIFDKSSETLLMYSNDKYDLTDKVLDRMVKFGK